MADSMQKIRWKILRELFVSNDLSERTQEASTFLDRPSYTKAWNKLYLNDLFSLLLSVLYEIGTIRFCAFRVKHLSYIYSLLQTKGLHGSTKALAAFALLLLEQVGLRQMI